LEVKIPTLPQGTREGWGTRGRNCWGRGTEEAESFSRSGCTYTGSFRQGLERDWRSKSPPLRQAQGRLSREERGKGGAPADEIVEAEERKKRRACRVRSVGKPNLSDKGLELDREVKIPTPSAGSGQALPRRTREGWGTRGRDCWGRGTEEAEGLSRSGCRQPNLSDKD